MLPFDSRLFFYIKGKTSSPGSQPPSKKTNVGSFLDDDKPPYHHLQKKWVKLNQYQWCLICLDLPRDPTGKTVKSSRHPPPGQWKVLELEFYTSEFCVQDPELAESKIYGLPLAMQGVCVCFRCFFCGPDICVGFKTDIYIYRGWQQQKDGVGKRQPKDVYRRKEHSLLRDVSQLFSEQVT